MRSRKPADLKIILASSSPRRKYLLRMLLGRFGMNFKILPAGIVEKIPDELSDAPAFVRKAAYEKAREVAKRRKGIIIGADTVVMLGTRVLGKPRSRAEAFKMLRMLSGRQHRVYTGISIINSVSGVVRTTHEMTKVNFRRLSRKEVAFYVRTDSPMDKAGAYGIQDDLGSTFVAKITGDYFNVVGLPVVKTYMLLKEMINLKY